MQILNKILDFILFRNHFSFIADMSKEEFMLEFQKFAKIKGALIIDESFGNNPIYKGEISSNGFRFKEGLSFFTFGRWKTKSRMIPVVGKGKYRIISLNKIKITLEISLHAYLCFSNVVGGLIFITMILRLWGDSSLFSLFFCMFFLVNSIFMIFAMKKRIESIINSTFFGSMQRVKNIG